MTLTFSASILMAQSVFWVKQWFWVRRYLKTYVAPHGLKGLVYDWGNGFRIKGGHGGRVVECKFRLSLGLDERVRTQTGMNYLPES